MKKLFTLALCACLVFTMGATATAIDGPVSEEAATQAAGSNGLEIVVNDAVISLDVPVQVSNEVTYVSYWPVVQALYPDATAEWTNDRAVVTAPGLAMEIQPGLPYFIANGRYLYLPQGIKFSGNVILLPVRTLCAALGADVSWDAIGNRVVITAGYAPITSGEVAYQADVLYWLSHIINAESGNQPLSGKIAVGNVVLNRVKSPRFPNSIHGVIFQRNQFSPVQNGTINRSPNAESVMAAKLCLDGAVELDNVLWFNRAGLKSWASRNRTFVATIAQHSFYA